MISSQLTLGVGLKDDATFENYYEGHNHLLIKLLQATIKNQGEPIIYFYGPVGSGRTHLLQACCHEAYQHRFHAVYLPLKDLIGLSAHIFDGLESLDLVCVDDVDCIVGQQAWEEAFFHAYNRIRDAGKNLIVAANAPPKALNFSLPDIISRLVWGVGYELQPLTDEEKLQVLIMRAERRGMTLPEDVGRYILSHCPRHMTALFAVLNILDKASLAAQRKLTIPFVKSILRPDYHNI